MSTQNIESHVFQTRCEVCDSAAQEARTATRARQNAIEAGWSFPVWFNSLAYVKHDLCPECAPQFLKDLDERGITYQL